MLKKAAPDGGSLAFTPFRAHKDHPVITPPRGASRPRRISKNEVVRWRRKDLWTVVESSFLLLGYLPTSFWAASWTPNVKRRLREAIDLIERAGVAGNLRALDNKSAMCPADVIAWADPVLFPLFPFPRGGSAAQVRGKAAQTIPPRDGLFEKSRRDVLDPAIDKAIGSVGGARDTAAVWLRLKDLALDSEPPFKGDVEGNALAYTRANNQVRWLTRDALRKRLKRRLQLSGR